MRLLMALILSLPAFAQDLQTIFQSPPEQAKPGVLWMWMGSNISAAGITKDLEALKAAGFNRATMFSLADTTTPWAGEIKNSPTPDIIAFTEPWWKLVRHAAEEAQRLGIEFGMHNCPGYTASGGPWIPPELSMQQLCHSTKEVAGPAHVTLDLPRPTIDPRAVMPYPMYSPLTGLVEKPEVPARKTYYQDVAIVALPTTGTVAPADVINLTGKTTWDAPAGQWTIYRFGHTTQGSLTQPSQWKATGLECDKMNPGAVRFHMDHVISEIKEHLGDLVGKSFTHVHFDSYEAGIPGWTPAMAGEFATRRGYDLLPFLPTFAKRTIGSDAQTKKFQTDFRATIEDLYRDVYFTTVQQMLRDAGLVFLCEPYGGPWRQDEIMPRVDRVMTEFWTSKGTYKPYQVDPTIAALRKSGQNLVEAEAFTGSPADSKWAETPAWLKPIGDAAYAAGINRFILHRFVHQPFDDRHQPGLTMGQWGTHFDRTQTWWANSSAPANGIVRYWQRCQALLQWGSIGEADFTATVLTPPPVPAVTSPAATVPSPATAPSSPIRAIRRTSTSEPADLYFIANTDRAPVTAICSFNISGRQPELFDPVTGEIRDLPEFTQSASQTTITVPFAPAQSFFIVFRKPLAATPIATRKNFPTLTPLARLEGPWQVSFDPKWGGPATTTFQELTDWTTHTNPGIRFYSGTAIYQKTFSAPANVTHLDLGTVNNLARVFINGRDLGTVWTAPWSTTIPPGLLKPTDNTLELHVTNVWANRLIGDEHEPPDMTWLPGHQRNTGSFLERLPDWFLTGAARPSAGRYTFVTWNYFSNESALTPSGLLGPATLMSEESSR